MIITCQNLSLGGFNITWLIIKILGMRWANLQYMLQLVNCESVTTSIMCKCWPKYFN